MTSRRPKIPNGLAYVAFFSWPLVTLVMFSFWRVERAAAWSLLGGYLLLPSAFEVDVSFLPPLNKLTLPIMTTFVFCLLKGSNQPRRPLGFIIWGLAISYILAPLPTGFDNSYELRIAGMSLPGFYPLDGFKQSLRHIIHLGGFYIGLRVFSSPESRRELVSAVIAATLIYSVPIIFEVRFSPQLHTWIYGYFPGEQFSMQMRGGGFRPVVFLQNGLDLALFVVMSLIATCVAIRVRWKILQVHSGVVAAYISGILVLCKTLGAMIYSAFALLMLLTGPRTWVKVASIILLLVCVYPALRQDIIPVNSAIEAAEIVSADRGSSLRTRIYNEDILLAKAQEKPLFGWGGWGRSRVFDPASGRDISITDGGWIIMFGGFGWLGYICFFGLLTVPVLRLNGVIPRRPSEDEFLVAGMSLLLAVNIFDMIPNANITPLTYVLAGSLAGFGRRVSQVRARNPRTTSTSGGIGNEPALATRSAVNSGPA